MAIEAIALKSSPASRHGRTTGAPIAMLIRNRDWVNWQQTNVRRAGDAGGRFGHESAPT